MSAKAQLTRVILRQIGSLGYAVSVSHGRGNVTFCAREQATGETYSVTVPRAEQYEGACVLAEMVGIELEDG